MCHMLSNLHFFFIGFICPSCFSSHLLVHPQPPSWQASVRSRNSHEALQDCPAIVKALGCCQCCFQHKSRIQHYTSYWEINSIQAKPVRLISSYLRTQWITILLVYLSHRCLHKALFPIFPREKCLVLTMLPIQI